MLRRILVVAATAAAVPVAVAPAADAQTVIQAQTVWRFDAASYEVARGGSVLFRNSDSLSPGPHNVTSVDNYPDGKPLFASETVDAGQESPVQGVERLPGGSYEFICTVHPFMEATLVIAPGSPPGSPPPPAAPRDTRAPAMSAAIQRSSLRRALRDRRVRVVVTSDEAVALRLRLTAKVRGRTQTLGTATGAAESAGSKRVSVRLTRRAVRALRRLRRVRLVVAVEARDSAGNVGTATARRSMRR